MNRLALAVLAAVVCVLPVAAQTRDPVVEFDVRTLDLRLEDGRWWLFAGAEKLKDLGPAENDAREALRIIHDLHLTHYSTLGNPEPIIEYWLADGRAPQAITTGLRLMPFNPEALRVDQVQEQWCLCDGPRVMFGFGTKRADAQQALYLLRHYGFNRVGYVGVPTPVMMYFLVSREPLPIAPARPGQAAPPKVAPPLELLLTGYQLRIPDSAANALVSGRILFQWDRVEVRGEAGAWKLMAGDQCLANFGAREEEARDALRVVQFYRFSERCRLGTEEAGLTYYLVNSGPPRGLMLGLNNVEFRAEALAVGQRGDVYYLFNGSQPIVAAGKSYEEACRVLQVIQRYEFDHVCQLGDADKPAMIFLAQDH